MSKELNKALELLREIRPSIPKDVLELWCKDRDAFLAQRSEFHQHLKECADEVATWPTYKREALGPFLGHELGIEGETETANELNKAPVEQAGGDERAAQWHECTCPKIGEKWNPAKHGKDCPVHQARAALAQPSPKCATCNGTGLIDDGEITCSEGGIPYENGPVKCVKDCPDCKAQPSPAQAEAERPPQPERYTADVFHPERPYYMAQTSVVRASDFDEFATQYERIVGALRAQIAEWQEAAGRGRSDVVAYIAERAKLLEGRDAALARVAELESKLAELEMQAPVAFLYRGTDMGDQLTLIRLDHYWRPKYSTEEHDYIKGIPLYAAPPAQAQHSVPEGWRIERSAERIVVMNLKNGAGYAAARDGESGIAESVLYLLAADLLAAAPGKEGV